MEYYKNLHTPYSTVSFRIILSNLAKFNGTERGAASLRQLSFL